MTLIPHSYIEDTTPVKRRFSAQTIAVLKCVLSLEVVHGYGIVKHTGLKNGTVYAILQRLSEREILVSNWDMLNKPPRQVFQISEKCCLEELEKEIESAQIELAIMNEVKL